MIMIHRENQKYVISLPEELSSEIVERARNSYQSTWPKIAKYSGRNAYAAFREAYTDVVAKKHTVITDDISGISVSRTQDGDELHRLFAQRVVVDEVAPPFESEPVDVVIQSFRNPSLLNRLQKTTPPEHVITSFTVLPY